MGSFKSFLASNQYKSHLPLIKTDNELCSSELKSFSSEKKNTAVIHYSQSCQMTRHCLCDKIKPILFLAQCFGLVPLSLEHVRNNGASGDASECQLVFHWKSPAVVVNAILILVFLTVLPFARTEIENRMSVVFSGTDLYAFTFQTLAMVFETSALLIFGRIHKQKFSQVRSKLRF